jgi:eukaryotic-like serine/threonine-protein kinase
MLAGKYRVERVLGAGGMGIVVAARHVELDQLVAIKFVREEAIASEDAVQRFLREARAAVRLKSEHVARVLDVGKLESGAPYMVMEFLEGSDLGKILSERGPLPADSAADWILQACEAVAEAHAAGIVHRDLKPENLFLARTVGGGQKIKVLDFGVSKAIGGASGEMSSLTRTRAMLGSPLYMAPEQMRSSRDVDARADVWALGVVLFQLLTQRWPFEAETMPELCLKVVTEPPIPLGSIRPDVPTGIGAVIERCLEKDLRKRFANAAELASALEPFVPPGSRVLADRARLAMGTGSGARSAAQLAVAAPSPTLQSGSGSTPGTSAPWGPDRVLTPTPQPALPPSSRSSRAVIAMAVVAIAGGAGFLLFARSHANEPSPRPEVPVAVATDLPGPAAAPPMPTSHAPVGIPAVEPAPGAPPVAPSGVAAVAPPPAIAASSGSQGVPAPSADVAGVVRNKIAVPARAQTGKATPTDDDIPTIR